MNITMYKLPQTHCRFPWEQLRNISVFSHGILWSESVSFFLSLQCPPPFISDQSESHMCFCETVTTITLGCWSWGWPSSTCAMPPAQCLESSAARKPTLRMWPSEGERRGATLLWLHVNRCSSGMSERERRWDCEVDITAVEQRFRKRLPTHTH